MLHLWSSAAYAIALPDGHRFPMPKYALLRDAVLAEGLVPPERLHDPGAPHATTCCSSTPPATSTR